MKPYSCPECGLGTIDERAVPGRNYVFAGGDYGELPADLVLPTCEKCLEWTFYEEHEQALSDALKRVKRLPPHELVHISYDWEEDGRWIAEAKSPFHGTVHVYGKTKEEARVNALQAITLTLSLVALLNDPDEGDDDEA